MVTNASNQHQIDIQKLNHALNGKLTRCPVCNQTGTFTAMPTLMELRAFHDGDLIIGNDPVAPLAVLTCQNCGNTLLINALATGLLDNSVSSGES